MKLIIKLAVVFIFLSCSIHSFAKASQVNGIEFFENYFDLINFNKNTESDIHQLIKAVNKGEFSASSESDLQSFVDLGFADELQKSEYYCSTKGCVLFLSLHPESSKSAKYGADDYIANIGQNYWYDFNSKDVFQSNDNYYLVLLK